MSERNYTSHLEVLQRRAETALERFGFDALLLSAGKLKYAFLDDRPYPFVASPHFKQWVPLIEHPGSWVVVVPGRRPKVIVVMPDDFWDRPPSTPSGSWTNEVELVVVRCADDVVQHLPALPRLAIVGEPDSGVGSFIPNNPPRLLAFLHHARGIKTEYELDQLRAAARRAALGHRAAREAFKAGESERDIHTAYLVATGHTDLDLPYGSVVALNEHSATLHHQQQDKTAPYESHSLLIDAGAEANGYASDVTRTWCSRDADFEALIRAVTQAQLGLVDAVRVGVDFRLLHLQAHESIATILNNHGIVKLGVEAAIAAGITKTFFPHGLGHLIGVQVHDVGGWLDDEGAREIERPSDHPFLRLGRRLDAGMSVTIEPGLYFIPSLLAKLQQCKHSSAVNWTLVRHLQTFGGIRIEDDVVCHDDGPENMSRDALTKLAVPAHQGALGGVSTCERRER